MAESQLSKELSPRALAAARWFRQLARTLKILRLYKTDNAVTSEAREKIAEGLDKLLEEGNLEFRIGTSEITLEDEPVVSVTKRKPGQVDDRPAPEEQLPFLIYQDGIRGLRLYRDLPREQVRTFLDALQEVGKTNAQDDLVTLLWQANLSHIQVDSVPLEQTIHLSSRQFGGLGGGGSEGHAYAGQSGGDEIRAELRQAKAPQGLHRDTFDDWELPEETADPVECYLALLPEMESARERFKVDWVQEWLADWNREAPEVLRLLLSMDDSTTTRRSLAHYMVTWLADSYQQRNWAETQRALGLLREFDPDHSLSDPELAGALSALDAEELAEQLDSAPPEDQARFLGLTVAIGKPALQFALAVMAHAARGRLRAAMCTALAYMCEDEPELLAPYLLDMRWFVVRNVVFILGQIGGSKVSEMLQTAANYPDIRVKRAVVHSLGAVRHLERYAVLLNLLDTDDSQLLAGALAMLTRDRNHPEVARCLLNRVAAPDFHARSEECQRALVHALGEVADEGTVSDLEQLLNSGGWFARPSMQRLGAARTLQLIGSERALSVLEAGLRSRSAAVRAACLDAMSTRKAE
jgi:hypothetical protein